MKIKLKYSIVIVLIGLIQMSCEKTKVEIQESNDPVFNVEGMFNGQPMSLVAGEENAYMFTMTEVNNGVDFYTGVITDGELSLKLGVYDGFLDKIIENTQEDISNSNPAFSVSASLPLAEFSKFSFDNEAYINYIEWSVDGDFVGVNEIAIFEPGKYKVCAKVFFSGGLPQSYCNTVILGYKRSANFSINYSSDLSGNLYASIDSMGYNVINVDWYVNDVFVSSGSIFQTSLTSEFSTIRAVVDFENDIQRTKSILVNKTNPYFSAEDLTEFEVLNSSLKQDFNLNIEFIENGMTYYSNLSDNSNATIVLNSIEFYGKNAMNKDVYKIDAHIESLVRASGGSTDYPISFNTVFGIEIP